MNTSQINELMLLVEENDFVDFGPFGEGTSELWIKKAEQALNIDLPLSYRWWLANYGGGEVGFDHEIFSIYCKDFEMAVGGDIVYQALRNKAHGLDPKNRLYIVQKGHHSAYFDTSNSLSNSEYPVIEDFDGNVNSYPDFLAFLIALIRRNE